MGNPSPSYGASPAIWDHTVLPATQRRQVLDLPTPEGWKAELTLVLVIRILRWFTCPQTVTHLGSNHSIATRPGVEHDFRIVLHTVRPPSHGLHSGTNCEQTADILEHRTQNAIKPLLYGLANITGTFSTELAKAQHQLSFRVMSHCLRHRVVGQQMFAAAYQ